MKRFRMPRKVGHSRGRNHIACTFCRDPPETIQIRIYSVNQILIPIRTLVRNWTASYIVPQPGCQLELTRDGIRFYYMCVAVFLDSHILSEKKHNLTPFYSRFPSGTLFFFVFQRVPRRFCHVMHPDNRQRILFFPGFLDRTRGRQAAKIIDVDKFWWGFWIGNEGLSETSFLPNPGTYVLSTFSLRCLRVFHPRGANVFFCVFYVEPGKQRKPQEAPSRRFFCFSLAKHMSIAIPVARSMHRRGGGLRGLMCFMCRSCVFMQ